MFEISGAMAGGMSGGPTVDLQGRVVGVNSFGAGDSEQFNFISPASEVQALMQDKGVENKLGKPDELYRAGLAAYNAGNREKALANLEQLLDMVPDHKAGEELRTRAMKLAAAKPAPRNDGGVPVAPIGLGLAALAALAALVIRRRRTTPATTVSEMPAADTAIVQLPVQPAPQPEIATLAVLQGPLAGHRIVLDRELVIGRGAVDLQLAEAGVSRRHAMVAPSADGPVVTDLGSSNGTTVNGTLVQEPVVLRHGDVIALGGSTIEVDLDGSARTDEQTAMRPLVPVA